MSTSSTRPVAGGRFERGFWRSILSGPRPPRDPRGDDFQQCRALFADNFGRTSYIGGICIKQPRVWHEGPATISGPRFTRPEMSAAGIADAARPASPAGRAGSDCDLHRSPVGGRHSALDPGDGRPTGTPEPKRRFLRVSNPPRLPPLIDRPTKR
jgi:hypothetical protein